MDPHLVLGLAHDATPAEIDSAYVRRLRLHDPDRQADDAARDAALRYRAEIEAAYAAITGDARVGTTPPEPAGVGTTVAARSGSRGTGPRRRMGAIDWLVAAAAGLAAIAFVRAPVAYQLALPGALACWFGAIGAYVLARAYFRGR